MPSSAYLNTSLFPVASNTTVGLPPPCSSAISTVHVIVHVMGHYGDLQLQKQKASEYSDWGAMLGEGFYLHALPVIQRHLVGTCEKQDAGLMGSPTTRRPEVASISSQPQMQAALIDFSSAKLVLYLLTVLLTQLHSAWVHRKLLHSCSAFKIKLEVPCIQG